MKKKTIICVAILLVFIIVFAFSLKLIKTHSRNGNYALPASLKEQIAQETKGLSEMKIIDYGLKITAQQLQFAENNDLANGKANCIGYARFCSAVCNQALKNNGRPQQCRPVVGLVYDCGINLCAVMKVIAPNGRWQNFVKDHDFVEMTTSDRVYYFDPTIYDLIGNNCLTIKSK